LIDQINCSRVFNFSGSALAVGESHNGWIVYWNLQSEKKLNPTAIFKEVHAVRGSFLPCGRWLSVGNI
jgi:hypothetical protein